MIRQHKFRGRAEDGWHFGSLFVPKDKADGLALITCGRGLEIYTVEVEPKTVGEGTGRRDKNHVEIFEDDILGAYLDEDSPEYRTVAVVEWKDGGFRIRQDVTELHDNPEKYDLYDDLDDFLLSRFEVIGNIHDNPELLKDLDGYWERKKCESGEK